MNIDEIQTLWDGDCKFDKTQLGSESLDIPRLHNVYYKILINERLTYKKLMEKDMPELRSAKIDYYTGVMAREDLAEREWEPFQRTILKAELPQFLDGDADMINMKLKIAYQKEKLDFLDSILKIVMNRSFYINNAIAWEKFINGIDH